MLAMIREARTRRRSVATMALCLAVWGGMGLHGQTKCRCNVVHRARPKKPVKVEHVNADLEMAKIYAGMKNWPEAETHYVLAAQDPASRKEALAGLAEVRKRFNADKLAGEAAALTVAKSYADRDIQPEAEKLYQGSATNAAVSEGTRGAARAGLAKALDAQETDRLFASIKEWTERVKSSMESLFWVIALLLGFFLACTALQAIARRRKLILLHEFKSSSDEASRALSVTLQHARARMQHPALAPGRMPGFLLLTMPTFSDELEPIEDLELGGSKIPFAALAKEWGRPRVQISGGFDAGKPAGEIFAVIEAKRASEQIYLNQAVRTQVPAQQQRDLFDFAYDVIVKASGAYVDA